MEPQPHVTRRKRSRFRPLHSFSLATLLLVVTALALALGLWVNQVHFQEQVIADLHRLGGTVIFEHERSDADPPLDRSWLQAWLGEAYFRSACSIHLEKTPVPHDLLKRIAQLPGITELSLREDNLSDDSLRAIGQLRKLKVLRVGFNPITDAGLAHLTNLHELLVLDLCVTKISDAGLSQIQKLPKLWRLELYGDAITDRGAATLALMPGLGGLDLANTHITSAGLEPLSALPDLSELRLDQMVLGEGQELRIDDSALPHLLAMPKLQNLSITSLPITPAAVETLKKSKPGIAIRQ